VVLVVGSSAGYGLAATVTALARLGARGVGVGLERPPGRHTASAGWYRTIATDAMARELGCDFSFVNADAFADTTKAEVLDLIARRFGGLDYLIYSVAAPRRTDPRTGVDYRSVIKPLGAAATIRTVGFAGDGSPALRDVTLEPASDAEAAATVKVMGGEDWSRWVEALASRDLIREGFRTVALSYVGPEQTSAIYREGTIGAAKAHLEATATDLDKQLAPVGGRALTSVNGVVVTQSSNAIPGIPLYVAVLRAVLGDGMQSTVDQSLRLWEQLTGAEPFDLDEVGRIRLDRWELDPAVQARAAVPWAAVNPANVAEVVDVDWLRSQFHALYGFDVAGVDYSKPVDPDQPWPTPS
jgi:enoyl-[acyl-carrier protein] reductase/trans-2-enoyl-CoA reductase (NAD+)